MFLQKTYKFAVGYIEIQIEGYFVERFINLCLNRNIEIWDVKKKYDGIMTLKIKEIDHKKIDEIAAITRSKVTVIKSVGVPHIAKTYNKRKIFILVCAIALVFIYLCSLRIWQIDITGDFSIPIEEIEKELEIENVHIGMKKNDLDFDTIKSNIYMRRNDILWMGFSIKGVKAVVEVVERSKIVEDVLKDKPCDIVADRDGVIEKINVRDGMKAKNVGDVIFKGDILVSGVVTSEYSEDRYVHSNADIEIKTWYTGKMSVPFQKTVVTKTGNVEKNHKINLGNYTINLSNTGTNFEKYDTMKEVKKLTLFGKFELPIEVETIIYEEFSTDEIKYTKEQAEILAKEKASNIAKQSIPLEAEIIDSEYKVFYADDEVIVRVTIECREKIGVKSEIIF